MRNKKRFTPTWGTEILAFSLSDNFLLHFRKKTKLPRGDGLGRRQVSRVPRLPAAQAGAASSRQHTLGSQLAPTTQLNRQETSPCLNGSSSRAAPSVGHLGLSILVVSSQLHWKAHKQREGGSRGGGIRSPTVFISLYLSARARGVVKSRHGCMLQLGNEAKGGFHVMALRPHVKSMWSEHSFLSPQPSILATRPSFLKGGNWDNRAFVLQYLQGLDSSISCSLPFLRG